MSRLTRVQLGQLARDLRRATSARNEDAVYDLITTLTPVAHTVPGAKRLLREAEDTFLRLHRKKSARTLAREALMAANLQALAAAEREAEDAAPVPHTAPEQP